MFLIPFSGPQTLMINLTFYDCGPDPRGDVQCLSWVEGGGPEELTPFLRMGKDCGQAQRSGWWLLAPCASRRNSSDFSVEILIITGFPTALFSCLVLVFSRLVPVVLQGLLSCSVCVYINISSLLEWTNKKLWSSAKSQIMSQLVPGTRASRELPRQGGVTGLQLDREHNGSPKAKCGGWIYGTSVWFAKQNLHIFLGCLGEWSLTLSHPKCSCSADIKWTKLNNLCAPAKFSSLGHWGLK